MSYNLNNFPSIRGSRVKTSKSTSHLALHNSNKMNKKIYFSGFFAIYEFRNILYDNLLNIVCKE